MASQEKPKYKVPARKDWDFEEHDFNNELSLGELSCSYFADMFRKTLGMFEYKNLPDGITYKDMEKFTQLKGKQFFLKHNGRAYILTGSFKDYITWNKEPASALIVNPALPDLPSEWKLGEDGEAILYPNDSIFEGLYDILNKNAIQMASTDISLLFASFNTRFKTLFVAETDEVQKAINNLITDLWNGEKPHSIVSEKLFKDSIQGVSYQQGQSNDIKDLIELKQYIKANWYMDLGLNANYNMKREAINESEMSMNDDALLPLIDDMLRVRKDAIEKINAKWGYNIQVDLASSWKKLKEEIALELKAEKKATEEMDEAPVSKEVEGGEVDDNTKTE